MNNQFDINHQFLLYLKRVDLHPKKMPIVQLEELRRAFFAAWGQQLMTMGRTIHFPPNQRIEIERDIMNQLTKFWEGETAKCRPSTIVRV